MSIGCSLCVAFCCGDVYLFLSDFVSSIISVRSNYRLQTASWGCWSKLLKLLKLQNSPWTLEVFSQKCWVLLVWTQDKQTPLLYSLSSTIFFVWTYAMPSVYSGNINLEIQMFKIQTWLGFFSKAKQVLIYQYMSSYLKAVSEYETFCQIQLQFALN